LVPFVEDTHEVTAGHRRGTRAFTRQHGDDLEPAKCLRLRRTRRRATREPSPAGRRSRSPSRAPSTRVPPPLEGEEEENSAVDPPSSGLSRLRRFR